MPLRVRSPLSANSIPPPATRSLTVEDTRTSPESAMWATRAPMCTASPASLRSSRSHSPVWIPARKLESELVRVGDDRLRTADRSGDHRARGRRMVRPFQGEGLGVRYRGGDSCGLGVEAASAGVRLGFELAVENEGGN
jgi:hypothetical protein